jgi:hypothetical protein
MIQVLRPWILIVKKAQTFIDSDLIIWDEAPMAPLHALNCIDRLLKVSIIQTVSLYKILIICKL